MKGGGGGSSWYMRGSPWLKILFTTVMFKGFRQHGRLPADSPFLSCTFPYFLISLVGGGGRVTTLHPCPIFSSAPNPSTTPHLSPHPLQYSFLSLYISPPLPCDMLPPPPNPTNPPPSRKYPSHLGILG